MLLVTTLVAAVVSFIAVKWLLRYVQTHTFNVFGWYRIGFAILSFCVAGGAEVVLAKDAVHRFSGFAYEDEGDDAPLSGFDCAKILCASLKSWLGLNGFARNITAPANSASTFVRA